MNEAHSTVSINLLGKQYKVKCPQHQVAALEEAAHYLEHKILETNPQGKKLSADQLMVITSLNIVYDFLSYQKEVGHYLQDTDQSLEILQKKAENAVVNIKEKGV